MTAKQVTNHTKISLLCFGNEWHGDDGFGHAVFLRFQGQNLPENVDLHFCGCNTMHAWNYMEGSSLCILIDSLKTNQQSPGDLAWHTPESFSLHSPQHLHDAGVEELLRHISILSGNSRAPEIELLCVTTRELEAFTEKLTPAVETAVETAYQMIISRLSEFQEVA